MAELGYTCCLCGGHFADWGNDPWPVVKDDDARCCDACNVTVVIPARIRGLRKETEND